MNIVCLGGGPAGLYLAILMKKADPAHRITVIERNRPSDTFGFGVVFSDQTLSYLRDEDAESYDAIERSFYHWDNIDIFYRDHVVRSCGHGFAGLGRNDLLRILQQRALQLGVEIVFEREIQSGDVDAYLDADLVVGSDGLNSVVRARFAESFQPQIDWRPNRFVWLGCTQPLPAFTFYFDENEHGLWRVHAYRYTQNAAPDEPQSTFIVECTAETFLRSGLDPADEDATVAYCEKLFAPRLDGHKLCKNRSLWRSFPTVSCGKWSHKNVVLLGDAVHTAHFSIGSGTKLAMEDAIALVKALRSGSSSIREALTVYESERRPIVESLQRTAQTSLEWFEHSERFMELPPWQFGFSLLTRSLRLTHENLRLRDPNFIAEVNDHVAAQSEKQAGIKVPRHPSPPPMFTPLRIRDLILPNRIAVSPMCQYSAEDGTPNDWHLVHLGSRAIGGAGLVIAEMTDVCREGRITPGCVGMYKPEHIPAWRRIVDFVHAQSDAKIGVQLAHAGRKAACALPWKGDQPLPDHEAWPIIGPSAIPWDEHSQIPREMSRRDMSDLIADFVAATEMAHEAGFDLLELHMAHGYLLSSFISPLSNLRNDEYGGALANRMRFPLEVVSAVRAAWPEEKPISVRISAHDWAPGGLLPGDAVEVARMLKLAGIDIVDVSSGGTAQEGRPSYGRLYQTPFSEEIRLQVGIATMAVGNISSYSDVNSIIAAGRADLALLARAHLFDPYWTRHAAADQGHLMSWPDQYQSVAKYRPRFK